MSRVVAPLPALAALSLLASPARALVWPDVADKIEADLGAADGATRQAAAHGISSLGPERGDPLALVALGDPDTEVRLAAADAAIRLRAQGATDMAMAWLNAPDARLRKKACEIARVMPERSAVALLGRALGDPDAEVRGAAADALGRQNSQDAVPPLLGRLDDRTPAVRVQIVEALARLGDPRAIVPLVSKVQDSSPEVRQVVARALGDLGNARATPALALALRDQSVDVRREALGALGRIRATDAVDAIAPFASERTPSLRVAALSALGQTGSAEAIRVLLGALGTQDDATASLERTPVRDALVVAGAAAIAPLGELLAGSPTPASATSAAWVLGELRAQSAAPAIVSAMRRGALPTTAAMRGLAGAGTAREVPLVLEFVADPNPAVRGEAINAAMSLLDPLRPDGRVVEPLAAALRDPHCSAQDRARIAGVLGRTGAPRAASVLLELVHARDMTLRLAAIDALGRLGPAGSRVDEMLVEAIASSDATVRLHAAVALSQSGSTRARDSLLRSLDEGDEVDRPAVLTALGGTMARAPTDDAVARLRGAIELAAGPERDALIEVMGRAPLGSAVRALLSLTGVEEAADRRAVAVLLAGHPRESQAVAATRAMLGDGDAAVRAQATWSLGSLGDGGDLARLEGLARGAGSRAGADLDSAINATAAIGRIAARSRGSEFLTAVRALCALASDTHAYVRANALAGLGAARGRCADGSLERHALLEDRSEEVRAAAAIAVSSGWDARGDSSGPGAEDRIALDRCAHTDPSGTVAARCERRPGATSAPATAEAMLVYVVSDPRTAPRPGSAYAMLLADGMIHVGTTDRRGAVFDPVAPQGEVALRRPDALNR